MITREDMRTILAGGTTMGLPSEIGYDTPLVVDSFTLVWLKHELEERYGLVVEPQSEDLDGFDSINNIHAYLARQFPEQVETEEQNRDR